MFRCHVYTSYNKINENQKLNYIFYLFDLEVTIKIICSISPVLKLRNILNFR